MEVYLDSASTTIIANALVEKVADWAKESYGNPSSLHRKGIEAERLIKEAKRSIAAIINASDKEIIFTSGGTEANNLAIKGAVSGKGRIICSSIEHPSVIESFRHLESKGYEWRLMPVDCFGQIDINTLETLITANTKLVSVMHVNNETGAIQAIEAIGAWINQFNTANKCRVLFHVDAVQGFGKLPIDVKKSHVDLMSMSGHKISSLKGTGALYVKSGVHLTALFSGGQQENGIRPGTENTLGIRAMGEAAQIAQRSMRDSYERVKQLKKRFVEELSTLEGVAFNGNIEVDSPYILNVSFMGTKGEVILHALESHGIYVSTGSACSSKKKNYSKVLEAMQISEPLLESAIRLSFHPGISSEEELYALEKIKLSVSQIRKIMKKK